MARKNNADTKTLEPPTSSDDTWMLRLYVAGQSQTARNALHNLTNICEKYLPGKYRIEVIDLLETPHMEESDQILAVPTVVRRLPLPIRLVVGDLSNVERTLTGLDLSPA
jgi:circadian clock protein KaiB